jgi:hypothetical protein
VIKSHEEHPRFAAALAEGRALAIYSHRDMRDVVYSMLHKRGVTFGEFLRQGMIHQVLANDRFWSRRPRQLVQRYDDLISHPVAGVEGLARHLGIALGPVEADEIAAAYSLEANRRRASEVARRFRDQGLDLDDPAHRQKCDEQTLLHWNHVRTGRVGDWLDRASPRERAILARLCNSWLAAHGYEPDHPPSPRLAFGEELALARGWLACTLRCASLRRPKAARVVKRALGISTEATPAARIRTEPASATPPVHANGRPSLRARVSAD